MVNPSHYYSLGCFGKLPIHSDFIRYQASGEEIRALDRWFQEGIYFAKSKLGASWQETFLNAASWRFIFHLPKSKAFLVGVVMPSRDRSGRTYPFVVFLRVDKKTYGAPLTFAALSFGLFLETAQRFAKEGWADTNLQGLIKGLEQMAIPAPEDLETVKIDYLKQLQEQSTRQFWTALFGDFSDPRKYLLDKNLDDLLKPMQNYPSRQLKFGLKFPLFSQDSLKKGTEGFDIPYWFERVFRALKKEDDPILFWHRNTDSGCPALLSFFSFPTQKQFLSLLRPELLHDAWFNLVSEDVRDSQKAASSIQAQRKRLLDEGEVSMAAFSASPKV